MKVRIIFMVLLIILLGLVQSTVQPPPSAIFEEPHADISATVEAMKKPFTEPKPFSHNQENEFIVSLEPAYKKGNCIIFTKSAYFSKFSIKAPAPYSIIISESFLKKLSEHKDRQNSKNRWLGINAYHILKNLDTQKQYWCKQLQNANTSYSTPKLKAINTIFGHALSSGKAVVINQKGYIQPNLKVVFHGGGQIGYIDYLIGDTLFFGHSWYRAH